MMKLMMTCLTVMSSKHNLLCHLMTLILRHFLSEQSDTWLKKLKANTKYT